MLTKDAVRRWYVVRKWTSLVNTIFVLIACVTGLALVFHHEIDHWPADGPERGRVEAREPLPLDRLLSIARAQRPGPRGQMVLNDPLAPESLYVAMAESIDALLAEAELLELRGSRHRA